jgi:hypothetical protein
VGGAFLVLCSFMAPWVFCGGLASLSGLDLARGITIFHEELSVRWHWLVALAPMGSLVLFSWTYLCGLMHRGVVSIQLVLHILTFLPLLRT